MRMYFKANRKHAVSLCDITEKYNKVLVSQNLRPRQVWYYLRYNFYSPKVAIFIFSNNYLHIHISTMRTCRNHTVVTL